MIFPQRYARFKTFCQASRAIEYVSKSDVIAWHKATLRFPRVSLFDRCLHVCVCSEPTGGFHVDVVSEHHAPDDASRVFPLKHHLAREDIEVQTRGIPEGCVLRFLTRGPCIVAALERVQRYLHGKGAGRTAARAMFADTVAPFLTGLSHKERLSVSIQASMVRVAGPVALKAFMDPLMACLATLDPIADVSVTMKRPRVRKGPKPTRLWAGCGLGRQTKITDFVRHGRRPPLQGP
jgi:hypothetical protein